MNELDHIEGVSRFGGKPQISVHYLWNEALHDDEWVPDWCLGWQVSQEFKATYTEEVQNLIATMRADDEVFWDVIETADGHTVAMSTSEQAESIVKQHLGMILRHHNPSKSVAPDGAVESEAVRNLCIALRKAGETPALVECRVP